MTEEKLNNDMIKEEQSSAAQEEKNLGETGQPEPENQELSALQEELNKSKSQAEEYLQLLQRVQADFDNYRRRTVQEREEASKYCSMRLVTNLLPILDNFERAFAAAGDDLKQFMEGMELIYRKFKEVLEKEGVKAMDAVGHEFDPNFHEAVMQAPSDEHPDNIVMEEFQKGYMLADRVIRPAMVKVAKS